MPQDIMHDVYKLLLREKLRSEQKLMTFIAISMVRNSEKKTTTSKAELPISFTDPMNVWCMVVLFAVYSFHLYYVHRNIFTQRPTTCLCHIYASSVSTVVYISPKRLSSLIMYRPISVFNKT